MSNPPHALIQVHNEPLGKLMQRIAVRYSRYRHRLLRTTGHSFERRYKAWLIDTDEYFVTLLRYIHLNPVKACIVTEPAEYQWTSHRVYLGTETLPWVTSKFGLGFFGSSLDQARISYRNFMTQPSYASEDRLLDDVHPDDPRIIGTDRFLASLPLSPYRPKSSLTLEQVAKRDMPRARHCHRRPALASPPSKLSSSTARVCPSCDQRANRQRATNRRIPQSRSFNHQPPAVNLLRA
jgi:hypothetical protein